METKQSIRKLILAERQKCSDEFIAEASRRITERILELFEYRNADTLLVYADYRHEVSTRYLIKEAWRMRKHTALPKVCGKKMDFYEIRSFDSLKPGYMGIPEPADTEGKMPVCPEDALVIMPGLAFDHHFHRIGYGGGYYDRFLLEHPGMIRLAVAFDFQIFRDIPSEETDLSPEIIVSETMVYRNNN